MIFLSHVSTAVADILISHSLLSIILTCITFNLIFILYILIFLYILNLLSDFPLSALSRHHTLPVNVFPSYQYFFFSFYFTSFCNVFFILLRKFSHFLIQFYSFFFHLICFSNLFYVLSQSCFI